MDAFDLARGIEWQEAAGHRLSKLILPEEGQVGFTQLATTALGIQFTNRVSRTALARRSNLTNGSGVALGDTNGDGLCDIYFCRLEGDNELYLNQGGWRFQLAPNANGAAANGHLTRGAAFADVDGDGSLDLLLTTFRKGTLCLLNDGKGQFADATAAAGLEGRTSGTTLALAALAGRDFLLCLLGLTAISLAYNIAPLRLKERPGLDIAANGASLGFLLPLAGWSLSQPLGEFPRLYFASVVCYLVAFYCPTMAVDVVADRAVGTTTFATRFGAVATMRLSWAATTAGAGLLLWSGATDAFPWDRNLLWWTGWILLLQPLAHWRELPPNAAPDYETVRRGSIILATIAALATASFLWLYMSGSPVPPFRR